MTAAAFKATYSDFKLIRSRKVIQIVLEVPLELSNAALTALDGLPNPAEEKWVAVARLDPEKAERQVMPVAAANGDPTPARLDTSPASGPDIPVRARKPVEPENRVRAKIAILCGDPLFQAFLCSKLDPNHIWHDDRTERAAEIVRAWCKVKSRSEIIPGSEAESLWDTLYSKFVGWRDVPEMADAS